MPRTTAPAGQATPDADAVDRPFVAAGDDDALRLPDSADLLSNLRFSPADGRITLGRERMVLLHVSALGELRRALIDALGIERTRALLLRVGYTSGYRDALESREIRQGTSPFELLSAGPQLHALEGMAAVAPIEVRFDRARGEYHGEFLWRSSAEVEAAALAGDGGRSPIPACWLLLGYATGYTTGFMGRPVVYRELACRSCGARHCRILGRPLDAWDAPPEGFEFLADAAANAPASAEPPVEQPTHELASAPTRAGLVGVDPSFLATWALVEAVAPTPAAALIHGEVGSGRSTLAAAIHRLGAGAAGPLVTIGAGHLAVADVDDALARAAGGTLVVDDLDAWPEASQRRLLGRLGGPGEPVGGGGPRLVITLGRAPEDPALAPLTRRILLRSGAFAIHAPPLRERPRDLLPLAHTFLKRQEALLQKPLAGFTRRARRALEAHAYAGNLHELAGLVARAAILGERGAPVDVGHLFGGDPHPSAELRLDGGQLRREAGAAAPEAPLPPVDLDALAREALDRGVALDDLEEALIRSAVERAEGNLAAAARTLGLTRPQLAYRYRKIGDEGGG